MNTMPEKFLWWGLLVLLLSCAPPKQVVYRAQLVKPPVGTMQLAPAIFLPRALIDQLAVPEGNPVQVTHDSRADTLRVYFLPDTSRVFAMHQKYAAHLGLDFGRTATLTVKQIDLKSAGLAPKPVRRYVENYPGDRGQWQRIAIGAPHGDCDMETGEIVRLLSENYRIPATAAYGCRLSYRGIWFDCNRPLMKLPKPGGGVFPERVWNEQAEAVYRAYQDSVWQNSGLHSGELFDFFCSFHGHDLTVRLPDGKRIERPVIEGMGIGFTPEQLRAIKDFYNRHKETYFSNPPALYFGNLPEDRKYRCRNVTLQFFYSGLGTRTYGSLRSDIVRHALHLETPNSIRLDPAVQPKTAEFLHELYVFVKDSLLKRKTKVKREPVLPTRPPKGFTQKVRVPGGEFPMGAAPNRGWASERPVHRVKVAPFEIDVYEVTNRQFVDFLNTARQKNLIRITDGVVQDTEHPEHVICRTKEAAPFAQIEFNGSEFNPAKGKEFFPVVYVSYYGAELYARQRGARLPTEAEWEMAAAWDPQSEHHFRFATASDTVLGEDANFENSGDAFETGEIPATTPVGYFSKSSPLGVYDMSGNVWEWCRDWYQYDYYQHPPEDGWENPAGPAKSSMRTIRGGAWNTEYPVTRTTMRLGVHPNATLVNVGFRCVAR